MTIQSLKEQGYQVNVVHLRLVRKLANPKRLTKEQVWQLEPDQRNRLEATGGTTYVDIIAPDGVGGSGSARCMHHVDNYDKKEGVKCALDRAWEDYESRRN